jgi:hypothetical protein
MPTFEATIEETYRRLVPAQLDLTVQLQTGIDDADQQVTLTIPPRTSVAFGEVLSIDMELMYVTDWNPTTSGVTVERGFLGSTPAAHATNTLVYVNPRFTRFDIGVAINQELQALSAAGLYQVKTNDIPYNPVFMGYNLTNVEGLIDVIGVRYKQVTPNYNFPTIKHWSVLPYMTDPNFPSGTALTIYEAGFPGLPIHVWYTAAFAPLANLTDDLVTVAGLPPTATDIVSVGAQIIVVNAREIKRNFTESQPDPRKATEVPPAAVMNSTKALELWRAGRIADERGRLHNQLKYLKLHR